MTQSPIPPVQPTVQPATPAGPAKRATGLAVAALILGICGIIPFIGWLAAIVGIILAIVALTKKTTAKVCAILAIVFAVATPVISVVITIPAVIGARHRAKQIMCQTNLHAIGQAVSGYAIENKDRFPQHLKDLHPRYLASLKMLKCPSKPNKECGYFYFAQERLSNMREPAQTIIACDFRENHGGRGRNVLFADNHIQWMDEKDFQKALRKMQNDKFAEALRGAEPPQ